MILESLSCNNCGAPLEVPENANYVTCGHCGSRLVVRRTDTAHYTEVLGQIGERTERMSEDLESIRLQNELERIDREWQLEREQYMIQGRHGSRSLPTEASSPASVIGIVFGIIFTLIWTAVAGTMGAMFFPFGLIFPLFGMVFIGILIFNVISASTKAQQYRQAEARYLERRGELLRQMER